MKTKCPFASKIVLRMIVILISFGVPKLHVTADEFPANPERFDPYESHQFRVKWDNKYVAGIARVSPLKRTTRAVIHRDGDDVSTVRRSPGITEFAPIVLERGKTHDRTFENWADKVWKFGSKTEEEVSLRDFRKDIVVEIQNEAGQPVMAYQVFRCWPSDYQAFSQLDANGSRVLIERLTLQCEGWTRDTALAPPVEHQSEE